MDHLAEFLFSLIASIALIASLFIFHKFWAKTAKTYWVRIIVGSWLLVGEIWFLVTKDIFVFKLADGTPNPMFMYWELCAILTVTAIILMVVPSKLNLDLFLPFAILAPIIVIVVPTADTKSWGFDNFRYWNYYFGHLGLMFAYLYTYLFGYTKAKLSWQSIRRSAAFAFFLSTFLMVWNMAYVPNGHSPLEPAPAGEDLNKWWGPNYLYKFLMYYLGMGRFSLLNQYFMMIFVLMPVILIFSWTLLYFLRPMYANCGAERLKFDIHENILGFKTIFTKDNFKQTSKSLLNKITVSGKKPPLDKN
ncbi:TMEM164 family acyltransferase [Williamsoniiplasma luminosum]|uniref:TIGR02206 family membrane protein n=1 Tax=Williamsoniiplasma luminosum TaxID=214888 RepID=A0A2S0NJZ6_9MOLU|nr:YwaF family protein [Williamsoniiplasma luminosum]AVP49329.1 MAG: hypothetical protein C5T88_01905 [Williamsoniiplasma luminosum]